MTRFNGLSTNDLWAGGAGADIIFGNAGHDPSAAVADTTSSMAAPATMRSTAERAGTR